MIDALDTSLERFLRRVVPLESGQVDVVFGAPDRDWSAQRSRPTVGLFLHSVTPAPSRAKVGTRQYSDGPSIKREVAVPIMAFRYMITVWVADAADEHRLLGAVLRTLASSHKLPVEDLEPELKSLSSTPELSLIGEKDAPLLDLWSALGVSPRASIDLTVFMPAGPAIVLDTAAPPSEMSLDTQTTSDDPVHSNRRRVAGRVSPELAGRVIVGPRGSGVIDKLGRFVVNGASYDELRLLTEENPEGEPLVPFMVV